VKQRIKNTLKLLETIRFENGKFENLNFHQKRMNESRLTLFGYTDEINLNALLQTSTSLLQESTLEETLRSSGFAIRAEGDSDSQSEKIRIKNPSSLNFQITNLKEHERLGLFKCRIIYSNQIEKIEFTPYTIPSIKSLKIVVDNQIEYSHKYLNRAQLHQLYEQKEDCDDILIAKNGLITDTCFANILFYNGKEWVTPAKPLLKGTQRAMLLEKEKIMTANIRVGDLKYFAKARMINAMIRFEDGANIDIDSIII